MTIKEDSKSCPYCGARRMGEWFKCGTTLGERIYGGRIAERSRFCLDSQVEIIEDSLVHTINEAEALLEETQSVMPVLKSAKRHLEKLTHE